MRTLLLDDDPMALRLLAEELGQISFVQVSASFEQPLAALDYLQQNSVDLIITDVEMPLLTGVQLVRALQPRPLVIFCTGYRNYAADAFELDAVDYLVKPYSPDRLLRSVNKAWQWHRYQQAALAQVHTSQVGFAPLFVKSDYKDLKIEVDKIIYIQALKDYVKIYLEDQARPVLTQLNLKQVEGRVPSQLFSRVHRSFIVNVNKVTAVNKTEVLLGETAIPLGEFYRHSFLKLIGKE